jgi:hypothetical protein
MPKPDKRICNGPFVAPGAGPRPFLLTACVRQANVTVPGSRPGNQTKLRLKLTAGTASAHRDCASAHGGGRTRTRRALGGDRLCVRWGSLQLTAGTAPAHGGDQSRTAEVRAQAQAGGGQADRAGLGGRRAGGPPLSQTAVTGGQVAEWTSTLAGWQAVDRLALPVYATPELSGAKREVWAYV